MSPHSFQCRPRAQLLVISGLVVDRLLDSICHWGFFVFQEGPWQSLKGTEVLRASICLVDSLNPGVSGWSLRDAVASGSSSPRRVAFSSRLDEVPGLSLAGSRSKTSTISSPFRLIKGDLHFWSSHTALQRTLVSTPELPAQHCSVWAKARVFSFLTVQRSLVLEASAWGRNHEYAAHIPSQTIPPTWCLLLCEGQPECQAYCCEKYKALDLLRSFPMVYLSRVYFLMTQISFYQWGDLHSLSILVLIHWSGSYTGSGIPLTWDCDQEWAVFEGCMETFGWAPSLWVGWHWWPP